MHQKGRQAVVAMQCPPPIPLYQDSSTCYNYVKRWCTECPTYNTIHSEKNVTVDDPLISFQQYIKQYKCSEHDTLKKGIPICRRDEERRKKSEKYEIEERKKERKDTKLKILLKYIEAEYIIHSMSYYDDRQRNSNWYNDNSNCYVWLG